MWALLSVGHVSASSRRGKVPPEKAEAPPITLDELRSNRESLLKFNVFDECSSAYAIAIAVVVNGLGGDSKAKATKFPKRLEETMAMGAGDLQVALSTIDASSWGGDTPRSIPGPLTCTPLAREKRAFFSMKKKAAQLIEISIRRLLNLIKAEGDKFVGGETFTAMSKVRLALNAILDTLTVDQKNVLNAMAEFVYPQIGSPDEGAKDVRSLISSISTSGYMNVAGHPFEEKNYFVPVYALVRRLVIASGGRDFGKDLFHSSDKGLQAKLGTIPTPKPEPSRTSVPATPVRESPEDTLKSILSKVKESKKCSKKFTEFVSDSVTYYVADGNTDSFDKILEKGKTGDVATCSPMFVHVGDFISISKSTAETVARELLRASASGNSDKTRAQRLSEIAGNILTFLEPGQLMLAEVMSDVVKFPEDFYGPLCNDFTQRDMSQNLNDNYFVSLYQFLKKAQSCAGSPIGTKKVSEAEFEGRCRGLVGETSIKVDELYRCLGGESYERHKLESPITVTPPTSERVDEPDSEVKAAVTTPDSKPSESSKSSSNKLESQTTILSSIATQEKLFFTNFHNAAQQLSILGIKAVGLATQIQAIRGHMMMLKLIDEHIAQLDGDHTKYTDLLDEALKQLEIVTESPKK